MYKSWAGIGQSQILEVKGCETGIMLDIYIYWAGLFPYCHSFRDMLPGSTSSNMKSIKCELVVVIQWESRHGLPSIGGSDKARTFISFFVHCSDLYLTFKRVYNGGYLLSQGTLLHCSLEYYFHFSQSFKVVLGRSLIKIVIIDFSSRRNCGLQIWTAPLLHYGSVLHDWRSFGVQFKMFKRCLVFGA